MNGEKLKNRPTDFNTLCEPYSIKGLQRGHRAKGLKHVKVLTRDSLTRGVFARAAAAGGWAAGVAGIGIGGGW